MKAFGTDAGRYVWCRSQALWMMTALVVRIEDMDGALPAEQHGLVRYSAAAVGEDCAVMLALVLRNEKPMPGRNMRAAWALSRIAGHPLAPECARLIRGIGADESDEEINAACQRLVAATREIVGEVPDALASDGYFPALALAREWYTMLDALGQEGFFPEEWSRRAEASEGSEATEASE